MRTGGRASPAAVAAWRSTPVVWIGRILIAVVCAAAIVVLVRDSLEIL